MTSYSQVQQALSIGSYTLVCRIQMHKQTLFFFLNKFSHPQIYKKITFVDLKKNYFENGNNIGKLFKTYYIYVLKSRIWIRTKRSGSATLGLQFKFMYRTVQCLFVVFSQNDPVVMGLLKSTMLPLQQVLEGESVQAWLFNNSLRFSYTVYSYITILRC